MNAGVRRALAAVLVALVLGQLAAQRLLHRGVHASQGALAVTAAAGSSRRLAMQVSGGLLHLGRLTLQPCSIGGREGDALPSLAAWCTRLSVPEDWQGQSARRIELAVALVPAVTGSPDPDLVTFLDGGPGGAAREDYPAIAGALAPLRERHAILLLDQRGTGASNPLDCPALQPQASQGQPETQRQSQPQSRSQPRSQTRTAAAPSGGPPPHPAGAAAQAAQLADDQSPALMAQRLQQCLVQLQPRASAQFYTTTEAVRDLEAVRQALGAPQLDVIGVSYGTRVAQQYAARYPGAVRSVVLDSPVPNRLALLSEHARNLEQALRLQFAQCRATPACAARFGDPEATLLQLRDRLRAAPVAVTLPDPVTFMPLHLTLTAEDLAAVVRFDAYNALTAALLPLMIDQAAHGDYVPLLGQKTLFTSDLADQITGGAELSVLCAEDADLLAPRAEDADSLLGNDAIVRAQAACRVWPRGSRPADFHSPFRSTRPVLVLDGALDPVTPPSYGSEIVASLPHARQLVVPGQGHGVMGAGCMPRLLQRFVESLDPARLDASCLAALGPIPAFIDFDGASP